MTEVSLKIEGMSCQHCVNRVKKAIEGLEGVNSSEVSIGSVKALFDETRSSADDIVNAVQNVGYKVVN